jgi:hypothetical protein
MVLAKSLYVHIGCHKTGTTSIQHALASNEETLQGKGILFYYRDFHSGQNRLPDLHSWIGFFHEKKIIPWGMRIRNANRLARELAALNSNVVISSENFSFIFDKEEIFRLRDSLSGSFSNIKVICYIRRQDQHVISHHREGSRLSWDAEHDLYGHSTRAIPPHTANHDFYLNYCERLSKWADAFGNENMIIKVYDRRELVNGDSVADFFRILGIDNFKQVEEKNSSLGFFMVKFGHLINSVPVRHKKSIVHLLGQKAQSDRRLSPSKKEALEYYQKYVESNRMLNDRFHISSKDAVFDDDFSMYPDSGTDVWDEQSANDAILGIIKTLDGMYGVLDVDALRDAAVALEGMDVALSYKLINMAHKFRPHGSFIKNKLSEYKAKAAAQKGPRL